jgi:hypothetical protein
MRRTAVVNVLTFRRRRADIRRGRRHLRRTLPHGFNRALKRCDESPQNFFAIHLRRGAFRRRGRRRVYAPRSLWRRRVFSVASPISKRQPSRRRASNRKLQRHRMSWYPANHRPRVR